MGYQMSDYISIHALREESDDLLLLRRCTSVYFNPRPPRGERPQPLVDLAGDVRISIHALREESDETVTLMISWYL